MFELLEIGGIKFPVEVGVVLPRFQSLIPVLVLKLGKFAKLLFPEPLEGVKGMLLPKLLRPDKLPLPELPRLFKFPLPGKFPPNCPPKPPPKLPPAPPNCPPAPTPGILPCPAGMKPFAPPK